MSLATVRAYIWKKPEDLTLNYRVVQGRWLHATFRSRWVPTSFLCLALFFQTLNSSPPFSPWVEIYVMHFLILAAKKERSSNDFDSRMHFKNSRKSYFSLEFIFDSFVRGYSWTLPSHCTHDMCCVYIWTNSWSFSRLLLFIGSQVSLACGDRNHVPVWDTGEDIDSSWGTSLEWTYPIDPCKFGKSIAEPAEKILRIFLLFDRWYINFEPCLAFMQAFFGWTSPSCRASLHVAIERFAMGG
jgi:hypothetical protein